MWAHVRGVPLEGGFLNHWHAAIPVGGKVVEVTGVCTVQFDADGLIHANEVFFDRSELLRALALDAARSAAA